MWFLIIILIIVILYLLLNRRVESFEVDKIKTDQKALICYYGGAFREGNYGSTKSDTKYGYESQKNASITHEKLKTVLQEKGYQTDILINTRITKYSNKLEKWYDPYDMILNELSNKIQGPDQMIKSTINNINKLNKKDYKFILFVRIDLFLKPDFFDVLDTETDKVSFLAQNYDPSTCKSTVMNNDPQVVDLFLFIPKKYFYILDKKFVLNHHSWNYYKRVYNLKDKEMSFMSNDKFDSNSYKEYNKYYLMCSRKESKHTYYSSNTTNKNCPKYDQHKQLSYISEPCNYYIDKNKKFYTNI